MRKTCPRADRSSHIKRPRHRITPRPGRAHRRYVIFWDVESFVASPFCESEHRFRLGWLCVRRETTRGKPTYQWVYLDKPDRFWDVLDTMGGKTVWCLAHNVAYDLWMSGGLEALYRRGYRVTFFYQGGTTTSLRIKKGSRVIIFLDTLNWFVGALAEWGKEIGYPKGDVDLWKDDDETISKYCRRDVEILVRLWDEWIGLIDAEDLGSVAVTLSAQSMTAYRHRWMDHEIYLHSNLDALVLERAAYYGGRSECWHIGHLPAQRYSLLDVNAMYPSVMASEVYPCRLAWHTRSATVQDLVRSLAKWAVVARVRVRVTQPVVPVREQYHTVFPVGTFWTYLTGPDLELVLRVGEILDVDEVCMYDTAPLFERFVHDLYALRVKYQAQGRPLLVKMIKRMTNSQYGKWGQKREVWKSRPNDGERKPGWRAEFIFGTDGYIYSLCLGPQIFERVKVTESHGSFPAISAYVTAHARRVLWNYIERAGAEHVYYMDTDSLLVDDQGLKNLKAFIHPTRMGALAMEYQAESGEIRCLKDYTIGDRRRIKGLTRNARQVSDTDWDDLHWPRLRGLLECGRQAWYANTIVRKQLRRNYRKGVITPSGRVVPLEYEEEAVPSDALPF